MLYVERRVSVLSSGSERGQHTSSLTVAVPHHVVSRKLIRRVRRERVGFVAHPRSADVVGESCAELQGFVVRGRGGGDGFGRADEGVGYENAVRGGLYAGGTAGRIASRGGTQAGEGEGDGGEREGKGEFVTGGAVDGCSGGGRGC